MTHQCPCCGQPVEGRSEIDAIARTLPPVPATIVRALARDFGSFMRTTEVIRHVWGMDPSGGPTSGRVVLSIHMRRVREYLQPHGLVVTSQSGRGYKLERAA